MAEGALQGGQKKLPTTSSLLVHASVTFGFDWELRFGGGCSASYCLFRKSVCLFGATTGRSTAFDRST